MKKRFLLYVLGLLAPTCVQAQMPKWCNPPVLFDWSGPSQTAITPSPNTTGENRGSNGAYDQNGNLLFYVMGYKVVYPDGSMLANLTGGDVMEVSIVKVPFTCKDYYIIYTAGVPMGYSKALYLRLTWNGSGWNSSGETALNEISAGEWPNLAVSRQLQNKGRYVFVSSGNGKLGRFLLTNAGITHVATITNASDALFKSNEGELYEDANGYKYATAEYYTFGAPQGRIGVVSMDINGTYLSKNTYSVTGAIHGLEFVSNNQLLYSSDNGVYLLNLGTGISTAFGNTANCKDADIEKAADGKYYTIGVDGANRKLVELDLTAMTAVYTTHLYNNAQHSIANTNYRLVDQVDNENYNDQYRADLVIKDEPNDMGIEPTAAGLMITEGDVWNCHIPFSCTGNMNPRSTETDRMHVKIYNYGCATSQPAELYMHWTRARTGEIWPDHWYGPIVSPANQINGHPAGGDITSLANGIPDPESIPPIAPGGSYTSTRDWVVPDRNWYPLNSGHSDGTNPMICFLARVISTEDPISNEQPQVVVNDYVKRNNNVATRNSFILPTTGGRPFVTDGTMMIYNPSELNPAIGIRIRGADLAGVDHLRHVDIVMEAALYARWVQNGRKGTGIIDIGNNTVRITDYDLAEIAGINVLLGEGFNIVPSAMLDVDNLPGSDMRLYSFVVDHYYSDGSTGSPGIYHVDYTAATPRLAGAGNKVQGTLPLLSPNPTTGVLNITYTGMVEGASITLFDNLGRRVQQQALNGASSTVNIERLPAGLYFYRIENGKERFEGKVVKE